jgi:phosphoglucomutase
MVPSLLAAEMTARTGHDPAEIYREFRHEFGEPEYERDQAPATPEQKARLTNLSAQQVKSTELAGEKILSILTTAPGNNAALGGLKVTTAGGWFAARPSGTEDIYKIYVESFQGEEHLERILAEAHTIVDAALAGATPQVEMPAGKATEIIS